MRLVQLSDTYIVDLEKITEVVFTPSDGDNAAELEVCVFGDRDATEFEDDEAVTVWHRLRDFCEPPPSR